MKFCSYVVKNDTGFDPNPFWGYCTLAHCTPNHMGVKLSPEDWIMGTSDFSHDNKLIYIMKVAEKLSFDDYFADKRFQQKKPDLAGIWKKRCGDNIYNLSSTQEWQQSPSLFHASPSDIAKDIKYPFVYISERFWYFGKNSITIPLEFESLIRKRQGCKIHQPLKVTQGFINWIEANFEIGIHGMPRDIEQTTTCDNKEKLIQTKKCS